MKLAPVFLMGLSFFVGTVFANDGSLYLDVTNATEQTVSLVSKDPENQQVHGFMLLCGVNSMRPAQTSTWVFCENFGVDFLGINFGTEIQGKIEYQWKGENGENHFCTINYRQTDELLSKTNKTTVVGDCTAYDDPMFPSFSLDEGGKSLITLRIKR